MKKPFCFFLFFSCEMQVKTSTSTISAQPASQSKGIYTISHIPFGAICRDCMSTQVWYHVLGHYSYRWRNLFLPFFFSFEMQVKMPSRPRQRHLLSQLHKRKVAEGIYTISHFPFGAICRDCMSTQVWYHVLSQYTITTWKADQYAQPWIPCPSAELATHSAVK